MERMTPTEIASYIYNDIDEVDAIPEMKSSLQWNPSGIPWRFGWSWPRLTDDGFVVEFCPTVIYETMKVLAPEEMQDYLNAVIASIHLHIVHYEDHPDLAERAAIVDAEIHEMASGSVDLLSKVQLSVLDKGT